LVETETAPNGITQLHGTSRNPPSHAGYRRPNTTLHFSCKILFEWLAHQTTVRRSTSRPSGSQCRQAESEYSGVKKPLNPILGETFTCYWEYPDHTRGYYISEQTSHHPPKSSYFYMAPEHNIRIDGTLKPRSKFLGNSAASMMEGIAVLRFTNRGRSRGGEK